MHAKLASCYCNAPKQNLVIEWTIKESQLQNTPNLKPFSQQLIPLNATKMFPWLLCYSEAPLCISSAQCLRLPQRSHCSRGQVTKQRARQLYVWHSWRGWTNDPGKQLERENMVWFLAFNSTSYLYSLNFWWLFVDILKSIRPHVELLFYSESRWNHK